MNRSNSVSALCIVLLCLMGISGCVARSTAVDGLSAYDGVSAGHTSDAQALADNAVQALARRYPPGQTSIALISVPGTFGDALEAGLRRQGFTVRKADQSADVRMAYVLDIVQGEPVCYLQVKTSDGGSFGLVRELTNDPGVPVTEPPSLTAPSSWEPAVASRALPEESASAPVSTSLPPHTVRSSGTAAKIARRNHVAVADFCRWNGVRPDQHLPVGYRVHLQDPPAPTPRVAASSVPKTAAVAPAPVADSVTPVESKPFAATPEPTPVAASLPTDSPAPEQWPLAPGGLRAQMSAWTSRAGYQLVWKAGHDYDMESHAAFQGEFMDAVRKLFAGLQRSGYALRVTFYQGNNVMEVTEN